MEKNDGERHRRNGVSRSFKKLRSPECKDAFAFRALPSILIVLCMRRRSARFKRIVFARASKESWKTLSDAAPGSGERGRQVWEVFHTSAEQSNKHRMTSQHRELHRDAKMTDFAHHPGGLSLDPMEM